MFDWPWAWSWISTLHIWKRDAIEMCDWRVTMVFLLKVRCPRNVRVVTCSWISTRYVTPNTSGSHHKTGMDITPITRFAPYQKMRQYRDGHHTHNLYCKKHKTQSNAKPMLSFLGRQQEIWMGTAPTPAFLPWMVTLAPKRIRTRVHKHSLNWRRKEKWHNLNRC